jgi:hypothetical protein
MTTGPNGGFAGGGGDFLRVLGIVYLVKAIRQRRRQRRLRKQNEATDSG